MSKVHQLFGYFGDKYYMVPHCSHIVIPENIDYTGKSIQTQLSDSYPEAEIDMYHYHTDLVTTCNVKRVANMKEMIISEEIKNIDAINTNYVFGIEYELFNKDGKLLRSGTSETEAQYCSALITDDILEGNVMEYRKALVFDGRIEINVPEISRYGIRNACAQHPYILKIKSIYVASALGDGAIITETGSQVDIPDDCITNHDHHAYSSNYRCHMHDTLCNRNFASCFLTNAKVGTTMIDATVLPMKLEVPEEVQRVTLCTIPCSGTDYTIKINKKLNLIVLNLEVLLDNFNYVYDIEDIKELLKLNGSDDETDGSQEYNPDDATPIHPDHPDATDTSTDSSTDSSTDTTNNTDTTGDNTGENNNNSSTTNTTTDTTTDDTTNTDING